MAAGLDFDAVVETARRFERDVLQTLLPESGRGRVVRGLAESLPGSIDAAEVRRGRALDRVDLRPSDGEAVGGVSTM